MIKSYLNTGLTILLAACAGGLLSPFFLTHAKADAPHQKTYRSALVLPGRLAESITNETKNGWTYEGSIWEGKEYVEVIYSK